MKPTFPQVLSRCSLTSGGPICVKQFLEVTQSRFISLVRPLRKTTHRPVSQVMEAAGVSPDEKEVAKLARMAGESGEGEREQFVAFARKSEVFKDWMDADRKNHLDKAEIAFKVPGSRTFNSLKVFWDI